MHAEVKLACSTETENAGRLQRNTWVGPSSPGICMARYLFY
jgi:hypothetical protein